MLKPRRNEMTRLFILIFTFCFTITFGLIADLAGATPSPQPSEPSGRSGVVTSEAELHQAIAAAAGAQAEIIVSGDIDLTQPISIYEAGTNITLRASEDGATITKKGLNASSTPLRVGNDVQLTIGNDVNDAALVFDGEGALDSDASAFWLLLEGSSRVSLRIMGATRKMLVSMLIKEATLVGIGGGLIGVFAGALLMYPFSHLIRQLLKLPYLPAGLGAASILGLVCLVVAVIVCVLAAGFAAAKLLRSETYLTLREGG